MSQSKELENIAFWSDGTWCYISELADFQKSMPSEYTIITPMSEEYQILTEGKD